MPRDTESAARQYRLAKHLVEDAGSVVDAYTKAYADVLTPEILNDPYKLSNRAYSASKGAAVQRHIETLQRQMVVEEARVLVWDKRKAAKFLLDQCNDIGVNMDLIKGLRDEIMTSQMSSMAQLKAMQTVTMSMNDTARVIAQVVQEMNKLYGLSDPKVSIGQAVQIIIGGKDPEMRDDTLDHRVE